MAYDNTSWDKRHTSIIQCKSEEQSRPEPRVSSCVRIALVSLEDHDGGRGRGSIMVLGKPSIAFSSVTPMLSSSPFAAVLVNPTFIFGMPWLSLWTKSELSFLALSIGTCRAAARETSTVDIARRIRTARAGLEAIFDKSSEMSGWTLS